jgi:hypothetical protein
VLRTACAQFVFLAGGADHDQMERMRAYLSALCKGWNVQQVREIVAETLHEIIDPIIYDEAVEPIGRLLGADRVVATWMEVGGNGSFTGEVEYYAYGPPKAEAVALGVPTVAGRTSVIRQHLLNTPAPVVAEALGYHRVTAPRLAAQAGGTWSRYAAGDHARSPKGWAPTPR